jgi:hypothetical protein
LLDIERERKKKISENVKEYVMVSEDDEIDEWIKEKEKYDEVKVDDVGEEMEKVEVMKKKFDDLKDDIKDNEVSIEEMNEIDMKIMSIGKNEDELKIKKKIEDMKKKWE